MTVGATAGVVLARLMPDVPHDDAAAALLWATGRIALDGRPPGVFDDRSVIDRYILLAGSVIPVMPRQQEEGR